MAGKFDINGIVSEAPEKSVEEVLEEQKMRKFLEDQAMIESSGGINTDHDTMQSGIHKGQTAVGKFGFMPNTIKEFYNRQVMAKKVNPKLQEIFKKKKEAQDIANAVSADPEVEMDLAQQMYRHVKDKYAGDEEKMNLSWFEGHNTKPEKYTKEYIDKHERTKKFRELRKKLASNK